ncbi:MAG: site-specific integrase [Aeromicrobium erythreum]
MTGAYVDPRAGRITFREYATQWQTTRIHRANTTAAVNSALRVHAFPRFGDRPIANIRRTELEAWVHDMTRSLAPSTVRVTFQHARSVFKAAHVDRIIGVNPAEGVKLPSVRRPTIVPLETGVVHRLADAMPPHWRALITLMAGTGLRPGEAAGLVLDRVDFLRRTLRVDQQLLLTRAAHVRGPPKSESGYRSVPLPQVVIDALARHLETYGTGQHDMLFTAADGSMLNRDYVTRAFRAAASTAGAPPGTRLHDLRHYYASLLIRHGESVKVVQARLGHASAKETLDTYSHLWPDSDDQTRAAVDSVLGAAATEVRHAD